MAKQKCPHCGKTLPVEDAKACPYCGEALSEETKRGRNTAPKTEQEMIDDVKTHLDDLETKHVEPNLVTIFAGGLIFVLVVAAFFTNGFGLFRNQASNPVAAYADSVGNLFDTKSASYERSLVTYDGDVRTERTDTGTFVFGKTISDLRFKSEYAVKTTGGDGVTVAEDGGTYVVYGSEVYGTNGVYSGGAAVINETFSQIPLPFLTLLQPDALPLWGDASEKNSYNEELLYDAVRAEIRLFAGAHGLTLDEKQTARWFELTDVFLQRQMNVRSTFDKAIPKYKKTVKNGVTTYEFTLSPEGLLDEYAAYFKGRVIASRYHILRDAFNEYAKAEFPDDPDAFWNDGIELFFEQFREDAVALGKITVELSVDRKRNLQSVFAYSEGVFEFSLKVTDIGTAAIDDAELSAFIKP
ncbi:MAG: zinc-ribbon domain-containing protein [Oscillospiraceae bacterium]|jgi:hypothetical protein|nr:zinc-ribbon domain-containing protein [Oscillospiraceae bacterium]